jgi:transposase-like protein
MKYPTKRLLTQHLKRQIVHRRYELGHRVCKISRELYVHPQTVHSFLRTYLARGRQLGPLVETRGRSRRTPCNDPRYDR